MADTAVYLNSINVDAFKSAVESLPSWATETTLKSIYATLDQTMTAQAKQFDALTKAIQDKANGSGSSDKVDDEIKKTLQLLVEYNKQAATANDAGAKRAKLEKDADESLTKRKVLLTGVDKIVTGFIAMGGKIQAVQKQYYTTAEGLYQSGINLVSGQDKGVTSMESLNQMVILTGIRLENLQEVIQKYSSAINAVGVNKFAKTISLTNTELTKLGFSSQQQADMIGTLLESESSYSDIRNKSAQEIANDSIALGSQLRKLSQQYGISIDELKANVKEQAKSTDSLFVWSQYGEKAAVSFDTFIGSFKDKNVSALMSDLVSAGAQAFNTPEFSQLATSGFADVLDRMNDIGKLGLTDATAAHKQFDAYIQTIGADRVNQLRVLAKSNGPAAASAKQMAEIINGARHQALTASQASEEQKKASDAGGASTAAFATELESAQAAMQKLFPLTLSQLDAATTGLRWFNTAINAAANSASATTRSWIAVGIEVTAFVLAMAASVVGVRGITTGLTAGGSMLAEGFSGLRGVINGFGSILGKLGTGLGLTAAAAFAAFQVWELIKASKGLSEANAHKRESDKTSDTLKKQYAGRTPEELRKLAAMDSDFKTKATPITVPKNPMQSTIDSPSTVSTVPQEPTADASAGAPTAPQAAVGSGIEKPSKANDINSLLTYQNNISEQLLLSVNKLVSVNSDILRQAKAH